MATWNIIWSQKYFGEEKNPHLSLKYSVWGHFYASHLRLLCHPTQPVFPPGWNRLLFSLLNTWWSTWLAFQGHVVPKKSNFKHLNHTRIVRCSYHESNSGTETKGRHIRFESSFLHSPRACALVGRGTDAPTLFTFFLSFSSWHSK